MNLKFKFAGSNIKVEGLYILVPIYSRKHATGSGVNHLFSLNIYFLLPPKPSYHV